MTTQSSPLKGSGAAILDYLYDEILGYYESAPGQAPRRPRDLGPNEIVFGLNQLHGSAAEALGIDFAATGGMTKAQFYSLAAGRHPVTGEQLVERRSRPVYRTDSSGQPLLDANGAKVVAVNPRTGEEKRETTSHVGIDVYFAAPKTVSIVRVVAEEENPALGRAISEAHARAVAQTLTQIEQSAFLGRRSIATPTEAGERIVTKGPRKGEASLTQGSVTERIPVQLLVASVAQHCARPTEETQGREAPPDMHLHQHNLIMNLGVDPTTGKVGAIDDYGLKAAAAKHDAWYLGHLSRELQDLGIELEFGSFEESRHGRVPWRVKGIDPGAEEHYSSGRRRAWNLAKDYEARNPGKAATQTVIKERMRGTRMAKDDRAKAQDSAPVWSLWTDDARKAGLSLASDELRTRMREGHTLTPVDHETRHRVLMDRLDSAKGLTMADATFTGADLTEALARSAEGLGYTADELGSLELELYDSLVVVREARDPRHIRYTTQTQLDTEARIETTVAQKVAARHPGVSREVLDAAMAGAKVDLDHEQRAVVEAVCSGQGAVFIEGLAGTGKTTAMATAVTALRASGAVDQVVVISTAARTAQSVGERLSADYSGAVEGLALKVAHGGLKMTPRTVVIYDESAMCDTRRQDAFLAAVGPARVVYVGDPHQAQPIGAGGWYLDAAEAHGTELLTAVHRQKDPADVAMNAALREGRGHEAVASLAARGRFHVSADTQGALAEIINHYRLHRDAGREASDVVVLLDSSNANVDLANRQIQHLRSTREEIGPTGFEVEETETGRHWSIHRGDRVLTLASCETSIGKVPNGTSATVASVDPSGKVTLVLGGTYAGRVAKVDLAASTGRQPLGLAYAVHTAKYQGGEAPVVLAMPGARGQSTKFTAYSTLTRAIEEVHVFPDEETHGPNPLGHLGDAWSQAPVKHSARRVVGERRTEAPPVAPAVVPPDRITVQDTPRHATPEGRKLLERDLSFLDVEMARLTRTVGPEAVRALKESSSAEELRMAMVEMREKGHDVTATLRTAARSQPLSTSDPAGDLLSRVTGVPRRAPQRLRAPDLKPPLAPAPPGSPGGAPRPPLPSTDRPQKAPARPLTPPAVAPTVAPRLLTQLAPETAVAPRRPPATTPKPPGVAPGLAAQLMPEVRVAPTAPVGPKPEMPKVAPRLADQLMPEVRVAPKAPPGPQPRRPGGRTLTPPALLPETNLGRAPKARPEGLTPKGPLPETDLTKTDEQVHKMGRGISRDG